MVSPLAAAWLEREIGDRMLRDGQTLAAMEQSAPLGWALLDAAAQFGEVALQRRQRLAGSASETAKPLSRVDGVRSTSPPKTPPGFLTVGQVAERAGCSTTWVRKLRRRGDLLATWTGRQWLIDKSSVEDFLLSRDEKDAG